MRRADLSEAGTLCVELVEFHIFVHIFVRAIEELFRTTTDLCMHAHAN